MHAHLLAQGRGVAPQIWRDPDEAEDGIGTTLRRAGIVTFNHRANPAHRIARQAIITPERAVKHSNDFGLSCHPGRNTLHRSQGVCGQHRLIGKLRCNARWQGQNDLLCHDLRTRDRLGGDAIALFSQRVDWRGADAFV